MKGQCVFLSCTILSVKFLDVLVIFSITIFVFSCFTKAAVLVENEQPVRFNKEVLTNSSVRSKRHITCGSNQWRCLYQKQCIDDHRKCNGQNDCADESDESIAACFNQAGSVLNGASVSRCILPVEPEHGQYKTRNISISLSAASHTILMVIYSCHEGHSLSGEGTRFCSEGVWTGETPVCEKQCRLLESTSVDFKCYKQQSTVPIRCEQLHDHNSQVKAECKELYYSKLPLEDVTCIGGSWDHTPSCTPECGMIPLHGQPFVSDSIPEEFEEFPWHVGIYKMPINLFKCSGSIVSPKLVVTAAHCVSGEEGRAEPTSRFCVLAGTFYKYFSFKTDKDRYVQTVNIKEIIIGERYKGESAGYQADIAVLVLDRVLVLSTLVRPICIRFDDMDLEGQLGQVKGWVRNGTRPSVLKTVKIPLVSYDECYEKSPPSFKSFVTLDKICARNENGTNACPSDDGGGLVLLRQYNRRQRFHLYGVLSIRSRHDSETLFTETCSSFIAFTDLRKHMEWFQKIWERHN